MGFLKRLLGNSVAAPNYREQSAAQVRHDVDDDETELVEIEVVGESHYQDALQAISGPKEEQGKEMRVGVTLRCEPDNEYDANAIRVEVMGQLLGRIVREQAATISQRLQTDCGGVLEAHGLIVGGWRDQTSEGFYGIRVWLLERDAKRIGFELQQPEPRIATPEVPEPLERKCRLSPTKEDAEAGRWGSSVTVQSEEHYQSMIEAALPRGGTGIGAHYFSSSTSQTATHISSVRTRRASRCE